MGNAQSCAPSGPFETAQLSEGHRLICDRIAFLKLDGSVSRTGFKSAVRTLLERRLQPPAATRFIILNNVLNATGDESAGRRQSGRVTAHTIRLRVPDLPTSVGSS